MGTASRDAERVRVAVIGAGPAGLMCARTLADRGVPVTVLDKGRRVGGRTTSRRLGDTAHADHGAPWFRPDDPRLSGLVADWHARGVIAPWNPDRRGDGRYVAVPTSRALAEHLAAGLNVHNGVRVEGLDPAAEGWRLVTDAGTLGPFDRVVVAVPAPQAVPLLAAAPGLAERAGGVAYAPCIAAMLRFGHALPDGPAVVRGDGEPLALAVRDSAKPGRAGTDTIWVLHGGHAWSNARLDTDPDTAARDLAAAFRGTRAIPEPDTITGHRWRHARATTPLSDGCLMDDARGIGACGDWCLGGGVDDALLSGLTLADRLLDGHDAGAAG